MSAPSQEQAADFDAARFARGFHVYNAELQDDPYPLIDRLRVAMEEIHARMPRYALDPEQPVTRHFGYVRGLDSLHLIVN